MVATMAVGRELENFVRESLVLYPRMFKNQHGEYLPVMKHAVQCQFNRSGHGFDILAVDKPNWNLWVIEVSAGKPEGNGFGQCLVKALERRKGTGGKAQMSPQWRRYALEGFMNSPDLVPRLAKLFDRPESEPESLLSLLNLKLNDHTYAVIVPEGVHVEGDNPTVEFASSIYTFRLSVW